ncbi:MAG TPA: KTSC domain-containing protein [Flavobacterium sp.]|nr:KTSC domain-containing protein [Flavobacterium sp.]
MRRQSVKSSNIAAIGHDETNKVLEIEFLSGGIYQYLDVPYYALMNLS